MLELLIVVLVTGIGFVSGYGVRELISRRRRRFPLGVHAPKVGAARHWARRRHDDDADALLAANDDISAGNLRQPPGTQQAGPATPPDELDGEVRDLLGELGRRTAKPPSASHRRRQ
ncbi:MULTISPECIES: hypothetical protein [unclassified Bradyrhizobium]|uniref:hypothetical protein n=1 Tax=unclassified Bradyrhizobium TaxID=2631580 RepID=UPI001BA5E31B|nr:MULTISPECIES: hypothetical protein [unclassified Bradyrhizobium]MBR1208204.1 hypothetical protein [Bradyrhizobium sp. AUGA SZCCT0124]MBR1316663.1 hypothetical protein [Bradyrhizobium sp. AUGA SZCCT0051]MBR1344831.1 hypothetical protein [Bradyrhizobium sp. AUGA SZCCT0105]MBR1359684.1 hypothetical protein [Bradyrhizobium sp. AUGA SZCCT0045]